MFEIVLEQVFSLTLSSASSGPDVQLFKRFQGQWAFIDQTSLQTGLDDTVVRLKITNDIKEEVIAFAQKQLKEAHPRNDYKELFLLTVIFLGGVPAGGVRFCAPAGLHRARWMARLIYGFKLFIFDRTTRECGTFRITAKEENGLHDLLCFTIAGGYIQAWFNAAIPSSAPRNDITFIQRLQKYAEVKRDVAAGATRKFLRHLWYLSEEMVGLAFFDSSIDTEEKRAMVQSLQISGKLDPPAKRIQLELTQLSEWKSLKPSTFVTEQTKQFFDGLRLPQSSLCKDPEVWHEDADYIAAEKIVSGQKVVNDTAERGVALIQEFNDILTNNEEQKQFLLQVVSQHRKLCPDAKNSTVVHALK